MWPITLSGRLPVVALVGHYPTNKLIGRGHILHRKTFQPPPCGRSSYPVLDPVSQAYPEVQGRLPTCYSPVRHSCTPEGALPFDLHVLSTPPAFVLSQDQTLHKSLSTLRKAQSKQNKPKTGCSKKTRPPRQGCESRNQKNLALSQTKHTVEFSNNTRTPLHRHQPGTDFTGRVSLAAPLEATSPA